MARDEKRRDPGEFYPGGRVWVKPGQSQPQVHVTWQQIEGKPQIAPLPDRYKDGDVKEKVNEIASKFATVVVAALIGWTAVADITVQKKRKDQIYNDEQVVVDVTGSGVGVDTNAVSDIVRDTLATNGIRSVDGAARTLPKYLHLYNADDSCPDAAEEYYRSRGNGMTDGGCSSVRSGGFLYRNFDYPFDERAEFVVKMSAGPGRFASVGVAQVGTNLTEKIVTSGKPEYSHLYKRLPGATVDGINENGVACNINVVDGDPQTSGWYGTTIPDPIHPLAAIRWILDHATNAQQAATYIASHIRFPAGWTQNFHYMIADETSTYVVENGSAFPWEQYLPAVNPVLTNYQLLGGEPGTGEGRERANLLASGANITNAWYTNAYRRETNPPWVSDLREVLAYTNEIFDAWASHPKEYFRNKSNNGQPWWQTVHTSVYDITNRVLRVAVQETADWYVFQVPSAGGGIKEETDPTATAKANAAIAAAGCVRTNRLGNADVNSLTALRGGLSAVGDDGYVGTFCGTYFLSAFGDYYLPWQQKIPKGTQPNREFAVLADIPDVSGFVPYTGAEYPVYLGNNDLSTSGNLQGEYVYADFAFGCNYTQYRDGLISCPDGNEYFLPGNVEYGKWPMFDFALRSQIEDATNGLVSAENPTFAAEVLKVQVSSLSTNITAEVYIAATNACANLGIDPALIPGAGTTGTVGGLIVMLFAVVFWMKRKIFDNGGKVTDDFVTECLGKPVAINALHYALYSVPTTGADANKLKDRSVNAFTFSGGSLPTFPAQVAGYARDFLLNVTATADGSNITIPEPDGSTATSIGDALAFTAGKTYLVAITEIAAKHYYIRVIDTTPANAA